MLIAPLGDGGEDVVFIGGDCFLQSLDLQGLERFWCVMSDKVTALVVMDFDGDGEMEVQ